MVVARRRLPALRGECAYVRRSAAPTAWRRSVTSRPAGSVSNKCSLPRKDEVGFARLRRAEAQATEERDMHEIKRIADLIQAVQTHGVVIGPKPVPGHAVDGWLSRVACVDKLFEAAAMPRVYVYPVARETYDPYPRFRFDPDGITEVAIDPRWSRQAAIVREVLCAAPWVYVHTVHLARFLLPFLHRPRLVVDVHGIVPEEEALYGNEAASAFYEDVERMVWKRASGVITVTRAMGRHLETKHGLRDKEHFVLPVFEGRTCRTPRRPRLREPPTVIYSGGAQRWQCIDDMVGLIRQSLNRANWVILSNDVAAFEERLRREGLSEHVRVLCADKDGLEDHYRKADFGVVLRLPIAVNRVSCPTKLVEYMRFGLVPIVKFDKLGDFREFGYQAIAAEVFARGEIPSFEELEAIRAANICALDRAADQFDATRKVLTEWLTHPPESTESRAAPPVDVLTMSELVSGPSAVAELSESTRAGETLRRRLNAPAHSRNQRFDLLEPFVSKVGYRPVQGPFAARVHAACFESATGRRVEASIAYHGILSRGDLCLSTHNAPGEIVITVGEAVKEGLARLYVTLELVAEGPEADALARLSPSPRWGAPVEAVSSAKALASVVLSRMHGTMPTLRGIGVLRSIRNLARKQVAFRYLSGKVMEFFKRT